MCKNGDDNAGGEAGGRRGRGMGRGVVGGRQWWVDLRVNETRTRSLTSKVVFHQCPFRSTSSPVFSSF